MLFGVMGGYLALALDVTLLTVGLAAIIDCIRRRGGSRSDAALFFLAPVAIAATTLVERFLPAGDNVTAGVRLAALAAQPYLLLRVLRCVHPVSRQTAVFAGGALAISAALLLVLPRPLPAPAVFAVGAYVVAVNACVAAVLIAGARRTGGVRRVRIRFAALGSLLIAAAVVLLGVQRSGFAPAGGEQGIRLIGVAAALAYLLAFAMPRALRRIVQNAELRRFLSRMHSMRDSSTSVDFRDELRRVAERIAVTDAVAFARHDPDGESWRLNVLVSGEQLDMKAPGSGGEARDARPPPLQSQPHRAHDVYPVPPGSQLHRALESGSASTLQLTRAECEVLGVAAARDSVQAYTLPVARGRSDRSALVVLAGPGAPFPGEDVDLLALCGDHASIILENRELLEAPHDHSGTLEDQMRKRTALFQLRNAQLHTLYEVSDITNRADSVEETLRGAIAAICEGSEFDCCHVVALEDIESGTVGASGIWHVRNGAVSEPLRRATERLDPSEQVDLVSEVFAGGEPYWTTEAEWGERFARAPAAREAGLRTAVFVPLIMEGVVSAVIELYSSDLRRPTAVDMRFFKEVGRVLGRAVERRRSELQLRRMSESLERRVTEQTEHLREVNRELESFSYSVSHDLRAPLRTVDGFATALVEDYGDSLDSTAADYLQRIRSGARHMGRLIDDLLDLSRITRKKLLVERVDLTAVARRAVEELQVAEPGRRVEVTVDDGMVACADASLARVLMSNLIGNAWKFTRNTKAAAIHIGMVSDSDPPEYFVSDNGAGFDMQYGEKLFGAFQRLHASEEFEGTGVGLATVQRIVHRHRGNVRAAGEIGRGARFHFTLGNHSCE